MSKTSSLLPALDSKFEATFWSSWSFTLSQLFHSKLFCYLLFLVSSFLVLSLNEIHQSLTLERKTAILAKVSHFDLFLELVP